MTDWIAWTKCASCEYTEKHVFQSSNESVGVFQSVDCPACGRPARRITFPAFDIETFERAKPGESMPDAMYDMMNDW
jgi:hypothetical protein